VVFFLSFIHQYLPPVCGFRVGRLVFLSVDLGGFRNFGVFPAIFRGFLCFGMVFRFRMRNEKKMSAETSFNLDLY